MFSIFVAFMFHQQTPTIKAIGLQLRRRRLP